MWRDSGSPVYDLLRGARELRGAVANGPPSVRQRSRPRKCFLNHAVVDVDAEGVIDRIDVPRQSVRRELHAVSPDARATSFMNS